METMMNHGKFDAVQFKRQAQEEVYEQLRDLSPEQRIAYFEAKAAQGPLGSFWRRLIRKESDGGSARIIND